MSSQNPKVTKILKSEFQHCLIFHITYGLVVSVAGKNGANTLMNAYLVATTCSGIACVSYTFEVLNGRVAKISLHQ